MDSIDRLSPEAITAFTDAVHEADGQEVCCVGKLDADGIVASIALVARGNESAVPALLPHLIRGDVVIHNHPSGVLRPSEPDIHVASVLGNLGVGFYIVDNVVDRVYVVAEPIVVRELVPLDIDELREALLPGGPMPALVDEYEVRDGQIEMLEHVARAFNDDTISVAEAGTGVGKSLAYLIPAIAWVENNDERVVVSTATINLQHQLVEKDIPLVKRILGSSVKTALVKGRNNYVCLRRLDEALNEDSLFDENSDDLRAIAEWANESRSGSKSDLGFLPDDRVWSRVGSEADTCVGLRCRFRERCFVLQARREAAAAKLLVVNHHLLFSDLAMRLSGAGFENTAVLPPFQRVVFDEAHNTENSATSYFSEEMSRLGLARQLNRLYRRRKGKALGLALALERMAKSGATDLAALIENAGACAEALDTRTLALLGSAFTLRIERPVSTEVRESLLEPMAALERAIVTLANRVQELVESLDEAEQESSDAYEVRIVQQRLIGYASMCASFQRQEEDEERIFWLERRMSHTGGPYVEYVITPLDVARLMREAVFEPYRTVICTSATLTVRDDFSFWMRRVGLLDFERRSVEARRFASPFHYSERVLLGVPIDAPDPTAADYEAFTSELVRSVLEVSEGSALVLFTSYEMLKSVYARVSAPLGQRGISVLKQGDDDRSRLLNRFTSDVTSVLFATDSFWEGVDAPGDTLRVVIICRLPFKVPTDPVVQARMEAIDRSGGSSFFEYALPTAVMRFKQGFGRLMRRQTDRGVVLVVDPRLVRKSYGQLFIESLPETMRSLKPSQSLLADIEGFLYSG